MLNCDVVVSSISVAINLTVVAIRIQSISQSRPVDPKKPFSAAMACNSGLVLNANHRTWSSNSIQASNSVHAFWPDQEFGASIPLRHWQTNLVLLPAAISMASSSMRSLHMSPLNFLIKVQRIINVAAHAGSRLVNAVAFCWRGINLRLIASSRCL